MGSKLLVFAGRTVSIADLVRTFIASFSSGSDLSTYVIPITGVGSTVPCHLVIPILGRATTARSIVSVKVHIPDVATDPTGVLATQVGPGVEIDTGIPAGVFAAPIPGGVTGVEVVIVFSDVMLRIGGNVTRTENLQSLVAYDFASQSTASGNTWSTGAVLDVLAGGALVAIAYNNVLGTFTWAELFESFDIAIEGAVQVSGASRTYTADQTGISVSTTVAAANTVGGLYVVSIR